MAEEPVVIAMGSSNMAGFMAKLTDVPEADISRWYGNSPALMSVYPKDLSMPGVRVLTRKLPYGTVENYTITAVPAGDQVTVSGTPFVAGDVGTWVFIAANTTGQGNLRRITVVNTASTVTVHSAWAAGLAANGTLTVIRNSHRVAAGSTTTVITKHVDTPAMSVNAHVGQFALFFAAYSSSPANAIFSLTRKITANDATTITLDMALGFLPANDTGFVILTGTGAAQNLAGIATGAALRPLAMHLDTAPVYLTGYDYDNWDATPFQSPLAALGALDSPMPPTTINPTVNCIAELAWQFRAKLATPLTILEFGVSSSMLSPFIFPTSLAYLNFSWGHDITQLDFHPSSLNSLYVALTTQITALRTLIEDEGNTMKVKAICINLADNDARMVRYRTIGANMVLLRDALRTFIGDQDIAWVMSGPSSYGSNEEGNDLRPAIYAQLEQIELEDKHSAVIDTREGYTKAADGAHLAAAGQIQLGKDFALAYDRTQTGSTLSDVGICNLALSHIGESANVTALDGSDTSAQAKHCRKFYRPALDQLLEQHPWDFATRREELVAVTNTRDEWSFAYEAPYKMAGATAVLAPGSANDAPTQPFIKEIDTAGRTVIYTDVEDAVVRYNRYITNTRKFSASFARALSWLIAADLTGPINKGEAAKATRADCLAMLRTFFGQATKHDSNQRRTEPDTEAPWMQ